MFKFLRIISTIAAIILGVLFVVYFFQGINLNKNAWHDSSDSIKMELALDILPWFISAIIEAVLFYKLEKMEFEMNKLWEIQKENGYERPKYYTEQKQDIYQGNPDINKDDY